MVEQLAQGKPEHEPQPRPIRILVEYDNEKVRYLEGENAENFIDTVNDVLGVIQLSRDYMLPEDFDNIEWKEVGRSEAARLFQEPPKSETR